MVAISFRRNNYMILVGIYYFIGYHWGGGLGLHQIEFSHIAHQGG